MRVLCFGGSFNPIHYGHLLCARAAAEAAGFEQVLLIPSAQPPHRQGEPDMATALDRLTMCRIAVAETPFFQVSDIECRRDTPSYTVETADSLRQAGWSEVNWLIGGDTVPRLPQWHDAGRLLREVRFVVMARPGWEIDWEGLPAALRALQQRVVVAPLIEISASAIRQRSREQKSIDFFYAAGRGGIYCEKAVVSRALNLEDGFRGIRVFGEPQTPASRSEN